MHQIYQGRHLHAVPAVHFRSSFANEVNRLCRDAKTRPDAIAVELGPETAAAAVAWMKELGVGVEHRKELPCMLGLARANLRVRASARERAIALQQAAGRALHELHPRALMETLGYSALSVLYLSPTDSIIEAIRCGLELEVPVYGVDLEETATAQRSPTLIEDPAFAAGEDGRLARYVARNAGYAERQRDEEVDSRREMAMAARLKAVLAQHGRVLFTGGLAHWQHLSRLLDDQSVSPARRTTVEMVNFTHFQRLVVHPLLAIHHMDVFPAFAASYEQERKDARDRHLASESERLGVAEIFARLLKSASRKHFAAIEQAEAQSPAGPAGGAVDHLMVDRQAWGHFDRLMDHLCLLNQTQVPDLGTVIAAAQGIMSPQFCECLAAELMEFDWLCPSSLPELPVLAPAAQEIGDQLRGEVLEPDGDGGYQRQPDRWMYLHSSMGRSGQPLRVKVPWDWAPLQIWTGGGGREEGEDEGCGQGERIKGNFNWPPISQLTSALSFRAMQLAAQQPEQRRSLPFEGSLHNGVDIKTTLRAHARGDDRVFVRETFRRQRPSKLSSEEWDPVIWIFNLDQVPGAGWDFDGEPMDDLAHMVGNSAAEKAIRDAKKSNGYALVEYVGYGRRVFGFGEGLLSEDLLSSYAIPAVRNCGHVDHCMDFQGLLLYNPPHFLTWHNAAWAVNTGFARNPIVSYPDPEHPRPTSYEQRYFSQPLRDYYRGHGLNLDISDWPSSMLLMALPFALRSVTVVAPDQFVLPKVVLEEASRRGKDIRLVPHSFFPRTTLRSIAVWYAVPAQVRRDAPPILDPDCIRAFDEDPECYAHLLPPFWRNYSLEPGGNLP